MKLLYSGFAFRWGAAVRWFNLVLLCGVLSLAAIGQPLAAQVQLPQNHAYQVVLRDHLASLTAEDLEVPLLSFVWDEAWMPEEGDELHQLWLLTRTSPIGHPEIVRTSPSHYLLNAIEGADGIRMGFAFVDPKQAAWLVRWDHPSNPYYDHDGLARRAFVVAAVDLMMLDRHHELGQARRSDYLGGSLIWMSYVYHHLSDRWPQPVQEAFEEGLHRMVNKLDQWGPTSVNDNMDTKALVSMHYIQAAARDPVLAAKAEAYALRVMGRVHASGMIRDAGGLEASYHGIATFFMAWARAAAQWDFLEEAVDRMSDLKAHLILPDRARGYISPSHFSTRTSFGIEMDQWSFYQRDVATAMLSPASRYLAFGGRPGRSSNYAVAAVDTMRNQIAAHLNRAAPGPSARTPGVWGEQHWPGRNINYAADYYRPGFYGELRDLQQSESTEMLVPFKREGETILRNFADTFLVYRGENYGTILYTGPIGWHSYMNYAGGSLSAFWMGPNQTLLLGHAAGNHTRAPWPEWRSWPTHALSGSTTAGKAFSSARIRRRMLSVDYELEGDVPEVSVSGPMGASHDGGRAVEQGALQGAVSYSRNFRIEEEGLVIETIWTSDGSDSIAELYEIFPVFFGDHRFVDAPPEVLFKVRMGWIPASMELVPEVEAIQVRTDEGALQIDLDHPRSVRMAGEVFEDDYMTRSRLHNIMISMVEPDEWGGGVPSASLTTVIRPAPEEEDPVPLQGIKIGGTLSGSMLAEGDTVSVEVTPGPHQGGIETVLVYDSYNLVGEALPDGEGVYQLNFEATSAGILNLRAYVEDTSGNSGMSGVMQLLVVASGQPSPLRPHYAPVGIYFDFSHQDQQLMLHYFPVFVLWNPSVFEIETSDYTIRQSLNASVHFELRGQVQLPGGSWFTQTIDAGGSSPVAFEEEMYLHLSELAMAPGEVLLVTGPGGEVPLVSNPVDQSTMNEVLAQGREEWSPTGGFVFATDFLLPSWPQQIEGRFRIVNSGGTPLGGELARGLIFPGSSAGVDWHAPFTDTHLPLYYQSNATFPTNQPWKVFPSIASGDATGRNPGMGDLTSEVVNDFIAIVLGLGPEVHRDPLSQSVEGSESAWFEVDASGLGPLSYQWQVSIDGGDTWGDIEAATERFYGTAPTDDTMDGWLYRVLVTDTMDTVASSSASLAVTSPATPEFPAVETGPDSETLLEGGSVTLSVQATGTGPLSYQWEVSNDGGETWEAIEKETSAELVLSEVTAGMSGLRYRVAVTNAGGTVYSEAAKLTVTVMPPAVWETIPGFGQVEVLGQPNRYRSETFGTLAFASDGANRSMALSESLRSWLITDGTTVFSHQYGVLWPTGYEQWVDSQFFGRIHLGRDADQYDGWVHSVRFGWMKFEESGGQHYLWLHELRTWVVVQPSGSFYSFDFGLLRPTEGFHRYHSSKIGDILIGNFNGWVASTRFGWVWSARDSGGVWFWSENLQDWIGVLPDGSLWLAASGKFLE